MNGAEQVWNKNPCAAQLAGAWVSVSSRSVRAKLLRDCVCGQCRRRRHARHPPVKLLHFRRSALQRKPVIEGGIAVLFKQGWLTLQRTAPEVKQLDWWVPRVPTTPALTADAVP